MDRCVMGSIYGATTCGRVSRCRTPQLRLRSSVSVSSIAALGHDRCLYRRHVIDGQGRARFISHTSLTCVVSKANHSLYYYIGFFERLFFTSTRGLFTTWRGYLSSSDRKVTRNCLIARCKVL